MKKLFLLSFVGLFSCYHEQLPTDVASRASGNYDVQSYVVDGDTIYSVNGVNKLGTGKNGLFVEVSRIASDTVSIALKHLNQGGSSARNVHVEQNGDKFEFLEKTKLPFVYESSIEGNRFYERTVGYNVDSLNARWLLDSLKAPYDPPLREIIIIGQKR